MRRRLLTSCRDEDGALSWFGIVSFVSVMIMGGMAIDISNAMDERTQLQVAADAAAHAALMYRQAGAASDAKTLAISVAAQNMPASSSGTVLKAENIEFGAWDFDTRVFTPDSTERQAVRIVTQQIASNGNPVPTFVLNLIGVGSWDVQTVSIFAVEKPSCYRDGFVSNTRIDIQGNNSFHNRFCLLSNNTIKLGSNNFFEKGVNVQLPKRSGLELPTSGMDSNPGLEQALLYDRENIKILKTLGQMITNLENPAHPDQPAYITGTDVIEIKTKKIEQASLTPGSVHYVSCTKGGPQINVASGTIFKNVVLVTNCQVKFESGVALESSVLATTDTDPKSFNSPSGLRLGVADNCAAGGGSRLLTMGGVEVASGLEMHGSQIIAKGDVTFSAGGGGLMGASIIAGGTISGTSNMVMGLCTTGLDDNIEEDYFRMVL